MKKTATIYAKALYLALKKEKNLKKASSNFYQLLRKNRDFNLLDTIFEKLEEVISKEEKTLIVRLETVDGITSDQEEKLRSNLQKKFSRKIEFIKLKNPQILGGLKIKIGDLVIDSSIYSKLKTMGENL